ncbi:hypothetical protein G9A89_016001 [Geosiphon pyriformis]|nr:hypothetical protein G9A89_016001 [Geosiphon pyriformis]
MEAKQSIISDDLKDWANQMEMESSTPSPISGVANGGAWMNVNGRQRFSEWVVSPLVPGATFKIKMALLMTIGDKIFLTILKIALFLAAFGSFFSSLAGGFSPVKIPSKRYTRISPNVVSTTSKSPKIFNNRPVNKLIFSVLTTSITTTTTTSASQMAAKAKNSKKHPLPDMNGNNNGLTPKIDQD